MLKNNWFFLFIDAIKDMDVPVYGFEALKNYRFNTAKPSTKIYISSHTDWFDAKVDIHFGEQKVTVADVKKALRNCTTSETKKSWYLSWRKSTISCATTKLLKALRHRRI